MNWNLPPNMDAKLRALQNAAQQPEEQMGTKSNIVIVHDATSDLDAALIQESQEWRNTTQTVQVCREMPVVAYANRKQNQDAENQLNINRIRRAELNQARLGGETIVEYRRYY